MKCPDDLLNALGEILAWVALLSVLMGVVGAMIAFELREWAYGWLERRYGKDGP